MLMWNRLSFSSSILKEKKEMDNDLIGKEMTTTTIEDLPEEVLTKVLVRLSVKDILACVSVQNSWRSLIKTRMFITLHSNYHKKISSSSTNHHPPKYLLFYDMRMDSYAIRVDDIQCEEYLTLKYPNLPHDHIYQLVSNGLICLRVSKAIYLCNPVIQKYKTLPSLPLPPDADSYTSSWNALAFGFVPQINDYLVVYIVKYRLKNKPRTRRRYIIMTFVYSLSTDSWEEKITLDSINPIVELSRCDSVFVNGVAIWVGYDSRADKFLLCFDTKTQMLRQILLPEWLTSPNNIWFPDIHAFDQSIAYFVEDNNKDDSPSKLSVWVLKGDPMNEFVWEKKMKVTLDKDVKARVLGIRNNGEPILCNDFDLISYNFDSRRSYDFVKSWDTWAPLYWEEEGDEWWDNEPKEPFEIIPFAESLALLDVDGTQY